MTIPKEESEAGGRSSRKFLSGRIARGPEEREQARQEHLRYREQKKARELAETKKAQGLTKAEKIAKS